MTVLFLPIDEVVTTGSGLIVSGEITAEQIAGTAAPAGAALTEMAGVAKVGKILSCLASGRFLKLAAEIWDRAAISKVIERVYSGLALNLLPDGKLLGCALVDRPDALSMAKRGGSTSPLPLHLGDARLTISINQSESISKMATIIPSTSDTENPFKAIKVGTNEPAANARAIEMIKFSRAQLVQSTDRTGKDFFTWLQQRAA